MAAWPAVKAWLVATIPTLPGLSDVKVYDGLPTGRAAPKRYVTVGFVEVDNENAGTYQRATIYDGTAWQEIGEVRCRIVAQSGTPGSKAQDGAFAIADALDAKLDADRTLDNTLSRDSEVHSTVDVLSITDSRGQATELVYVLTYTTTT